MKERLTLEELKSLIANAQAEKVIDYLISASKFRSEDYKIDRHTNKEILLLSSRLKTLSSKYRQGIISELDFNLERNKISVALIQIIENLETRVERLESTSNNSQRIIWILGIAIFILSIGVTYLAFFKGQNDSIEITKNEGIDSTKNNPIIKKEIEEFPKKKNINAETSLPQNRSKEKESTVNSPSIKKVDKEIIREEVINFTNTPNSNSDLFWKTKESVYTIYYKGEDISEITKSAWSGNDYVIFNPKNNSTYLLEDYKNKKDYKLRPAKILTNNSEDILWKTKESIYTIFFKGEDISEITKSSWSGDDYMIYNPKNNSSYILENYKNRKDYKIRIAKKM